MRFAGRQRFGQSASLFSVLAAASSSADLGGVPILGGYEDKTVGNGSLPTEAPVLKVNATAVFGGVKVANEPD